MSSARIACWGWLFAACFAPLPVVGCSSEQAPEAVDPAAEEDLTWGKADGLEPQNMAPSWLLSAAGSGTWVDEEASKESNGMQYTVVRGWADGRVLNRRYLKRVFVEVAIPYDNGTVMRTLHPAWFKQAMDNGYEKWGVDSIEIYPDGGPHNAKLSGPVVARLRMQEDPDGDGQDQVVVTKWFKLYGEGTAAAPKPDSWTPGRSYPCQPNASATAPEVQFPPWDDAGSVVVREIDKVIAAKAKGSGERHSIYAAIFNINDPRIVDKLIAAHQAGVEVRLLTQAVKLNPWQYWQTEDDRLLAAGVPLLGIRRRGNGAMHDKFVIFDGNRIATGSFNWETGSSFENHENMVLTDEPGLVEAYSQRFAVISGEVQTARTGLDDPSARLSVSYAPDEEPYRITGRLLEEAKTSLDIAMFTAKDVEYEEGGSKTSLFAKLSSAVERGVRVTLITDYGIAEGGEYFGVESPDDPADEALEEKGVHVVRADNTIGKYASMHHKFAVVDGKVLLTGAFNWYYDAAYLNDEDQLVWRDPTLAANYRGEFVDLLRRYDPAYKASDWPQVSVTFQVKQGNTAYGDTVVLVGDLPELGAWNPQQGISLDSSAWPLWKGVLSFPAGVRLQYKYVTVHKNGSVSWQGGNNRSLRVPTDRAEFEQSEDY